MMAGSIALTAIAGIVLGLAAGALGVIVQGVVVSEVAHAAVAEKLTLGGLWQRVKPVLWRLIGYALRCSCSPPVLIAIVALRDHRDRLGGPARRRRAHDPRSSSPRSRSRCG